MVDLLERWCVVANRFEISRADGSSDGMVLCRLVSNAVPGHVFTFDELSAELSAGSSRQFDRLAVSQAVSRSTVMILRTTQRALHSVRGEGYRVAHADDHRGIAANRKRRSDIQLRRAVQTLENVRWDEMDPNVRAAHQAQLMLLSALSQRQDSIERRLAKQEAAIRQLQNPQG